MAIWISSFLFFGVCFAHTGVKSILIDGQVPRELASTSTEGTGSSWSRNWAILDPNHTNAQWASSRVLRAPPNARHPPQEVKFFKIYEKGFDAAQDKWANQIASDNSDSYKIQLPSDIKSGTYILRTELIAMHGNMAELKNNGLRGQIQIYPHCFNLDIIGSGSATPDGVKFPGAYKPDDASFMFQPFMTYGNDTTGGTEHNSKFVPPGPPLYQGKYEKPTGPLPVVKETGAYPPDLAVTYQDLIRKIERPALKLATYINAAWPHYKADSVLMKKYGGMGKSVGAENKEVMASLKGDIEAFKKLAPGMEM